MEIIRIEIDETGDQNPHGTGHIPASRQLNPAIDVTIIRTTAFQKPWEMASST